MKHGTQYLLTVFSLLVSVFLIGCVNHTAISKRYEERTVVGHLADSGWDSSIWGNSEHGGWKQIWPAIPFCNNGEPWIVLGEDLIYIGWDKNIRHSRVVMISFGASPAIDISPQLVSLAIRMHLIRENWQSGQDFLFDGLVRNGKDVSVVFRQIRGDVFHGGMAELQIPPELLSNPKK